MLAHLVEISINLFSVGLDYRSLAINDLEQVIDKVYIDTVGFKAKLIHRTTIHLAYNSLAMTYLVVENVVAIT